MVLSSYCMALGGGGDRGWFVRFNHVGPFNDTFCLLWLTDSKQQPRRCCCYFKLNLLKLPCGPTCLLPTCCPCMLTVSVGHRVLCAAAAQHTGLLWPPKQRPCMPLCEWHVCPHRPLLNIATTMAPGSGCSALTSDGIGFHLRNKGWKRLYIPPQTCEKNQLGFITYCPIKTFFSSGFTCITLSWFY